MSRATDAPPDTPPGPSPEPELLTVRFTGTGLGYFHLWTLNALLCLLTLGLYWPFAQVRRQAYFHQHTVVGEDALGFHADPWALFQTHLLMLGLVLLNILVYLFMPRLSWLPAFLLLLMWPALWHASLVFRLRHTRWRGQDFNFTGAAHEAYLIWLPLCMPIFFGITLVSMNTVPSWTELSQTDMLLGPLGLALAGMTLTLPWWWARLHAFKHGGYAHATERSRLDERRLAKSLCVLSFKVLGGLVVLATVFAGLGGLDLDATTGDWIAAGLAGGGLLATAGMRAYLQARMHTLLWSQTRSDRVSFVSALRFRHLFTLHLQNGLLIALTAGLYWPFAVVRSARLKLHAISVEIQAVNTDEGTQTNSLRGDETGHEQARDAQMAL